MRKLYMLIGLPGSGKSTIAKRITEFENGAITICPDEIRKVITGDIQDQSKNKEVFEIAFERLSHLVKSGNPNAIIWDATNIRTQYRKEIVDTVKKYEGKNSYKIIYIFCNLPVEVCSLRNSNRDRVVPEEAIARMDLNLHEDENNPMRDIWWDAFIKTEDGHRFTVNVPSWLGEGEGVVCLS